MRRASGAARDPRGRTPGRLPRVAPRRHGPVVGRRRDRGVGVPGAGREGVCRVAQRVLFGGFSGDGGGVRRAFQRSRAPRRPRPRAAPEVLRRHQAGARGGRRGWGERRDHPGEGSDGGAGADGGGSERNKQAGTRDSSGRSRGGGGGDGDARTRRRRVQGAGAHARGRHRSYRRGRGGEGDERGRGGRGRNGRRGGWRVFTRSLRGASRRDARGREGGARRYQVAARGEAGDGGVVARRVRVPRSGPRRVHARRASRRAEVRRGTRARPPRPRAPRELHGDGRRPDHRANPRRLLPSRALTFGHEQPDDALRGESRGGESRPSRRRAHSRVRGGAVDAPLAHDPSVRRVGAVGRRERAEGRVAGGGGGGGGARRRRDGDGGDTRGRRLRRRRGFYSRDARGADDGHRPGRRGPVPG
mmetsp:Transcript_14507/g.61278  ORF Transcript_14507/g.61278 Transcript_14507/m.61278 type:complete len:417 (-) Transcript_14507:329-1579(-)